MAVARWLETDTNSNKDINTAVSIGAYTADADRMIVCDVSLDQVAGGGDYVVYITRQIAGAGSAYVMLPKTTCTAAAGETAIAMQSGMISVRSGDVLTVYVDGLAGDTTTPDTTVRFFEMATLKPTTADRTLDVAATGEAGLDFTNRLDTTGILPAAAAGASGGLPVLDANLASAANVTYQAGVAVAAADADGNVPVVLANTEHGGELANLVLRKFHVTTEFLADLPAVAGVTSAVSVEPTSIGLAAANLDAQLAMLPTIPSASDNAAAVGAQTADAHTWQQLIESLDMMVRSGLGSVRTWTVESLAELTGGDGDTLETLSDQLDTINALTAQETRDAMKLAPTAGDPAAGSIDKYLDDILVDTGTTLPATLAGLATAADLATVDGIVDDILEDTGTTLQAALTAIDDYIDTELAAIKAKTDLISASGSVSVTSAISGSTITILRGDSLSVSIATLGDISTRSKLWFTVKEDTNYADTAAIIQIEETAGLVRLNMAAATGALGDITVTDENAGNITITLDETATDDLVPRKNMSYDVQMLTSTGTVTTLSAGTLHVTADVTRAVA